jgi:hypothetical protein
MAPSRPAVYPDQWGLVAVIAVIFVVGAYMFARAILG